MAGVAGMNENTTDSVLNLAGSLGAAAAVPAAAVGYGAHRLSKELPKYRLVDPATQGKADAFKALGGDATSTNAWIRSYISQGSELAREPVITLPSGKQYTGAGVQRAIRGNSGLVGRAAELATGTPFTPSSQLHYKAFEKGPLAGYTRMAAEIYENPVHTQRILGGNAHSFHGQKQLRNDFMTTIGEARYETAKQLADQGKLHPTRFRQELPKVLQRKLPGVPAAEVAALAESLEARLLNADPKTYLEHLKSVGANQDATVLQDKLLRHLVPDQDRNAANIVGRELRRASRQLGYTKALGQLGLNEQEKVLAHALHGSSNNPLLQYLNLRLREGWKTAPKQYGNMIDPLVHYGGVHRRISSAVKNIKRLGIGGALLGGGLALAPLAAKALTPDKPTITDQLRRTFKQGSAHTLSRRMEFQGLNISIETDKGEYRHWYDPHKEESGKTLMKHPYGYIRRTLGVDGDHCDVYVGPNEQAKNVYVVNQMKKPKDGTKMWTVFDEQKHMLGFNTAAEAKAAYLQHYDDPRFFGSVTAMPFDEFKTQVLKTFDAPKRQLKISSVAYRLGVLHALEKLGGVYRASIPVPGVRL